MAGTGLAAALQIAHTIEDWKGTGMPKLAPGAISRMPRSGIREIMDQVWSMDQPVIPLHVGEPSFLPPAHVLEAARAAYAAGDTHYVPNAGTAPLRQAAAEKITRLNHFATGPDQVIIAAGAAQALHLALSMTISAGDEVLIPDPGWPNYEMAIQLLQGAPRPLLSPDPKTPF